MGVTFDAPAGFDNDADHGSVQESNPGNVDEVPFPAHIISLLALGGTRGDLVGGVTWTVSGTGDDADWSPIVIAEVEGNSLLGEHRSDSLTVAVYGYVVSPAGELIGHIHQHHTLPIATYEPRLRATGLRVVHQLPPMTGPVSVRLVIENPETQRFLVTTIDLAPPTTAADRPTLLPPLVHDANDAWLVVAPDGEQPDAGRVTLLGKSFVPATRLVAVNGQPTELITVIGVDRAVPIAARVVDRNGVTRASPRVLLGSRLDPPGTTPAMFSTSLEAVDLPPDLYVLELTLDEPAAPTPVLRALPIAVTDESRQLIWTAAGIAAETAAVADPSQLEARDIGSIGAQTAALLLSGQRGGEVLGSLIWSLNPTAVPGDLTEVQFFVELEGASLLTAQPGTTLRLGIFAYVFSSGGNLAGYLAQGLALDLRAYGEQLRNSGLKFAGKFDLPAGSHTLHLLVRNQDTGRLTLRLARVDVPAAVQHDTVLLPPVFPDPAGSWVAARQHGLDAESIGLAIGEARVVPAARAVVESGRPTDLFIGVAGWDEGTPIAARVVDIQGRHLAEPLLTVGNGAEVTVNDTEFFRATLGALDLPVGWYMLELALDDAASGARRSRTIPVAVIVNRRPTVWASLSRTAHTDQVPPPDVPRSPAAAPTDDAIVVAYLTALKLLADGDRSASRDAIVLLEHSVAEVGSSSAMSNLYRIQKRLALELSETDPRALVPIVLAHRQAFRHYLAAGEDRLADHAWRLAAELADDVPREPRQEQRPAFPETVLVAIAGDLVRTGHTSSAVELLERAVELAPDDPGALLALGATHERLASYAEAVAPLRSLVRAHPSSAEGALRLAINLARTGGSEEAAVHFRQLTTGKAPAWIQVLAFQELARQLRAGEAEELLREGLARFPSDQALQLQLAQLLDTRGRPWEAGSLIDHLASRASPPETSPRVRYPAWPSLGLEQRLVEFESTAEESVVALATAIQARTAVPKAS